MTKSKFVFRIITFLFIFILFCTVVYLFATKSSLGWFGDQKEVTTNLQEFSVKEDVRFELATTGELSYNNAEELDLGYADGNVITEGENSFYVTGSSKSRVAMRLDATSDFNNKTEESLLFPGSSGQLSFYILPQMQMEEDEQVTITVSLNGYKLNASNTLEELSGEYEYISNVLLGHILLFQNYDGIKYSNWVNGEFSVNITRNTITKVTLYWVWVPFFTNFLNEDTICEISNDSGSDYKRILEDICLNENNKYLHFEDENQQVELFDINNNFINVEEYSYCFNRDDEKIGKQCRYILLELSI